MPDTLSRYCMEKISSDVAQLIDLESPEFLSVEYLELLNEMKENKEQLPDFKFEDKYIYQRN